jgi:hypothetical protein
MERLKVVHKTKLTKEQTYFVNADDLSNLLSGCGRYEDIELRFSDDPSQFKSNYDRFVKQEGKLVILSVRYAPSSEDQDDEEDEEIETKNFRITVYAILKAVREDLIAQFETEYFNVLREWIDAPRDNAWLEKPHAVQFLIDIETEEVEVAYDIDFDSFSRHSKKQRFRADGRKHRLSTP